MTTLYKDPIFAPLDADLCLERIAGGNETEVYRTDDGQYVVKVKNEERGQAGQLLQQAQHLRRAANRYAKIVGRNHSVPSYFLVTGDSQAEAQLLVVQPYLAHAQPLFTVDYTQLSYKERWRIARQLVTIIRRSVASYLKHGWMPDLYGRSSTSKEERKRLNAWYMLPWRLWSFLIQRNLLRSHNLLLTAAPERRIILIDYDPVKQSRFYQIAYYSVRLWLFVRDLVLIFIMVNSGKSPGRL